MEKSYFDKMWELRKQATEDINRYISEHGTQMMDGERIVTFETYIDGLHAKYLMQVCQGFVWVSDFTDDEEDAWEEIALGDILFHSLMDIADIVINEEARKQ